MIPGVDATIAADLIQLRAGPDGVDGTDDDTPFRNAAGALQTAGLNSANAAQAGNLLTTRSSTFHVNITATDRRHHGANSPPSFIATPARTSRWLASIGNN